VHGDSQHRTRRCFVLRPFVLLGENLICSFVGRQMMAELALFLALEASYCMSFSLLFRWCLVVCLSVMCLRSRCIFVQVLGVAGGSVFLQLVFLCTC
jgi:hypothetical protein